MSVDKEAVERKAIDATKTVFDPEIPYVSIYELGLIYDVDAEPVAEGEGAGEKVDVKVRMTLTSPNCPAAQDLPAEVYHKIAAFPEVKSVKVDVVFDPPWTPDKMSDAVKLQLGML